MYISWPNNVNKIIIDSTSITVGENATVEDSLEAGGQKKKRLVSANPPDKYNVTMNFDCVTKGQDGYTELERFYIWYKHIHCYGVNPFEFPAMLINSNRLTGESQEDTEYIVKRIANHDPTAKLPDNEHYIITSAVEGSKSGNDQQVTMTWETYATDAFTVSGNTSVYIGWASDVNKIVIDSSTVTVGDGAVVADTLEVGGRKKKRLVNATPSDRYNVIMKFNFVDKDSNNLTELERFYTWYKYQHCYGVNPFSFPAILINPNRQNSSPSEEYYIITSAIEGNKDGSEVQISMTWETFATGTFTIPADSSSIDHIAAREWMCSANIVWAYIDVYLSAPLATDPTLNTWTVYFSQNGGNYAAIPLFSVEYDGDRVAHLGVAITTSDFSNGKFMISNFVSNTIVRTV
jgi:hypothetical protein